jgi:hypothetical protein
LIILIILGEEYKLWSSSLCSFLQPHVTSSLFRSFIQEIRPVPRLHVRFRSKVIFYGEELLAPRPTPKLEGHPLSAVRDCLFNIFAATLPCHHSLARPQVADGVHSCGPLKYMVYGKTLQITFQCPLKIPHIVYKTCQQDNHRNDIFSDSKSLIYDVMINSLDESIPTLL